MERRLRANSIVVDQEDPQSSSENGSESPLSGDDWRATATAPSPRRRLCSRRSIKKTVVTAVPIGDVDGSSRTKGEAYPPSDSWAWRKYGQKPIKGSPYPRGYYRCSSSKSKGCPARKQVERSRVDPTMLIITYASDHNHPVPISKQQHNQHGSNSSAATTSTKLASPAPPTSSTTSSTEEEEEPDATATPTATAAAVSSARTDSDFQSDEQDMFTNLGDDSFLSNSGEFSSWLSDVSLLAPALVGPRCNDVDVAMFPIISATGSGSMREEDESLFADLGELPECSAVFRRGERSFERCNLGAPAPLCGSTG